MPNPVARPLESERRAPENLDALVREAMRGGGVAKLRAALEQASEARPEPSPSAPEGSDPLPVPAPKPRLPADDWRDRLTLATQRVVGSMTSAQQVADEEALRAALADAESALSVAYALLGEPQATLPAIRMPWLLVLPPRGEAEVIAEQLGVDLATARMLAGGRWPRVGLRGEHPDLGRVRAPDHVTVSREQLLAIPAALGVLGPVDAASVRTTDAWQVTEERIWLTDPQGGGLPARIDDVRLVVPGEVDTRSTRAVPEESRWLRKRIVAAGAGTDRRVRVADLHTPTGIFRLVEGITRTQGLPGHDPTSARRSFTSLLNELDRRFPTAEILDDRVVTIGADGKSAWPQWEEHTRVCRLFTLR
jgi:hypothetical protein